MEYRKGKMILLNKSKNRMKYILYKCVKPHRLNESKQSVIKIEFEFFS